MYEYMKFTLNQLQYAQEVCFPADFIELFDKHAKGTKLEGWGHYYAMDNKHFKRDLIKWIFKFNRADRENVIGTIIEKMLVELIGDYEK